MNETKFERAALKNIIFALALCMFAAALGGCASGEPQNLEILKGDERERACAQTYERIRSLEAELLAVQNPYANPSVANDYISKSDELERTVRDYNKICAK